MLRGSHPVPPPVASGDVIQEVNITTCDVGDRKRSLKRIELVVEYFVPLDRTPLPDWTDRIEFYCRRIVAFHHREFGGASLLTVTPSAVPFVSRRTTAELREGNVDAIFSRTMTEVAASASIKFRDVAEGYVFKTLLVLSDICWYPLDDFYRLRTSTSLALDGKMNMRVGVLQHVCVGSATGGSRAFYRHEDVGWGLISADGWRVPCIGTDTVVYHEFGHLLGLKHPPADAPLNEVESVMSQGQYHRWLLESWIDAAQKSAMGMQPSDNGAATVAQCLPGRTFTAEPINANPRPREQVVLALGWPDESRDIVYGTVRVQTDIFGAWVEVARLPAGPPPTSVVIGAFDRPTPVSFRVNVTLAGVAAAAGGAHVLDQLDQWGYFQVRSAPDVPPLPAEWSRLDPGCERPRPAAAAIDVLAACVPYPGIAWVKPGGASLRSLPASQYDAFSTGVVFPS